MKKTDSDPLYLKYKELSQWRSVSINAPFINWLDYTCTETSVDQDMNDDLKRELSFYQQALSAVQYAHNQWKQTSTEPNPLLSTDTKMVMIKDGIHMKKVQDRQQSEQDMVKKKEQVERVRIQKKFAKQTRHKAVERKQTSTSKHNKMLKKQKNRK